MMTSSPERSPTFLNAFILFTEAAEACKRCQKAAGSNRRKPGGRQGIVSIVFSVAFADAFLNDIVYCVRNPDWGVPPSNPKLVRLVDALEIAEECHAKIRDKYHFAKRILTGAPYEKGKAPFQDFSLLVEVRNWITHMRPETGPEDGKEADLAGKLESRHILSDEYRGKNPHFMAAIDTPAVAQWAVLSAWNIVDDIIELLPECSFRKDWKEGRSESGLVR
jgi:hypothetical protein